MNTLALLAAAVIGFLPGAVAGAGVVLLFFRKVRLGAALAAGGVIAFLLLFRFVL